jgi:hypothetical protein
MSGAAMRSVVKPLPVIANEILPIETRNLGPYFTASSGTIINSLDFHLISTGTKEKRHTNSTPHKFHPLPL